MLAQESGDPITLKALVDWYVQAGAWDLVDEAAARFEHVFTSDPLLMYTAAQSKHAQGRNKEADEMAEKAFQLIPTDLEQHFETARLLMHRGIFEYSEREFRHVIAKAPPETKAATDAQLELAEMLHDQEQELAAAEVLHSLVTLIETDNSVKQRMDDSSRMFVPAARMHFFYA
jgi:tetratricopeptide (TPR) repeat protein